MKIIYIVILPFFLIASPDTLQIELEKSQVEWIGRKVTGEHLGTLELSEGWVIVNDSIPIGGKFIFDMNTIKNSDIESAEWRQKLENHLKDSDFFYVDSFPRATLEIKSANSHTKGATSSYKNVIYADLTIRGIKHEIILPFELTFNNGVYIVTGLVDIDRTMYNVRYKSSKFFDDLGDKLIYDDFTIKFKIISSS